MFDDGLSDFGFLLQTSDEEGATESSDSAAASIVVPPGTVIESAGSTVLTRVGDNYFLHPVGDSNGVQLSAFGAPVVAGQFGLFAPIAAEATAGGGYAVAWKAAGADQYTVLNADSSGAFQSHAFLVVSGGSYALQSIEPTFQQDMNSDGTVGSIQATIEAVGTARLVQQGDSYFLYDGSGAPGPQLMSHGTAVTVGNSGGWTPVGAEAVSGGYEVVWQYGNQFTLWTGIDTNGNFTGSGVSAGSQSYALQSAESTFGQDFNHDGQIGPTQVTIEAAGTRLVQLADSYFLYSSSGAPGPQLTSHGTAVTVGNSGGWTPVGAEAVSGGYEVVWQYGNQFTLWTGIDTNGNFAGSGVSAGTQSYALQSAESTFGQDFNRDGTVGLTQVTIEAVGTAHLVQLADSYFLYGSSGAPGPQLKSHGTAVTVGNSGGWTPVGAEAVSGGYQVVWQYGNQFTLWTGIDGVGNFAGSGVSAKAYSYALESAESTFGQDFNRDGTVGITTIVLESAGSTSLVMVADTYYLRQGNSLSGPQLTYGGAVVTMDMFGVWTPIGVEQTASGYQVAWRGASGSDQYQVWDVNSSGAFRSNYAGVMASANWIMKTVETTLRQDLNHDGLTGLPTSPYDIVINYSGDPGYQIFFDAAAARWEQVITADLPDVINPGYGYIDDLLIHATVTPIDGAGGILGSAGPDYIRTASGLPTHGNMQFDSADLAGMAANGTLYYVVLHEVGHIMGLGSLWSYMGLKSGSQYFGASALDAYRGLSGNGAASYVPLETSGGSGTAGVHWSEAVFGNELMTGYINGAPALLSSLTIGGLRDLGYSVNFGQAEAYAMPGRLTADDGSADSSSVSAVTISTTGLLTTDMAFIDDDDDDHDWA